MPDMIYCPTCGEEIRRQAEICPECGVRNELNERSGASESGDSSNIQGWYNVFVATYVGWVLAALWALMTPVGSESSVLLGFLLLVSWVGMPIAGYYDISNIREHTDWQPTLLWVVAFALWFVNLLVGAVYLYRRSEAELSPG